MPPETHQDPFHYSNNLRRFLADAKAPYPLGPWLASLDTGDLDFLTDAIDDYTRRGGTIEDGLFSDVLAVVVQVIAIESPTPSFTCSIEQLHEYVFTLGLCGAFEQMRRAGVAKILSPMILTSDHTPKVELIQSA
ncbi:hypothetical protein MYXO_01971 [Myxococcaceae bacterium]|nr:hypothetical protein MYXO_01971 [Myxococcaceae bacterium]